LIKGMKLKSYTTNTNGLLNNAPQQQTQQKEPRKRRFEFI